MRAKIESVINRIEYLGTKKYFQWCIWGIYTLLLIALCSIHEPWGDEHHVWSMVYHLSFPELWSAMRVEGHFCLWHLCVWPWVRIFGMDYHAIFVASTLLMSLAAWLMLFKLDFTFIGKLLLLFSAPFFYQFPVIARCYALIPPILIGIAIVYQRRKNPYIYCFLIGLLAHTHAYMEGMVAVLWCCFVYNYVYLPYKNGNQKLSRRNCCAAIITVIMVLLAFAQIAGGIIDAHNGTSVAAKRVDNSISWWIYFYENHHIQITTTLHRFVRAIPNIDLVVTLFCYCTIIILSYFTISKSQERKNTTWIVACSIVWQILFAINIYFIAFQRVYLLYLPLLYVLWITYRKENNRNVIWILLCFWLLNTSSQYQFIKDIKKEYCFDVSAANELNDYMSLDIPIVSAGNEVTCLFQKEIVCMDNISTSMNLMSDIETQIPNLSSFYFVTDSMNIISKEAGWKIDSICSVTEGNNEFTRIGYTKNIYLYHIYADETTN